MIPDSLKLTPVQVRIWKAVADYILKNGLSPAVRDIQAVTGSSTSVIHYTLDRLSEKGYVLLAEPNNNGNRPARSYQLLVWPMELAQGVPEYKSVQMRSSEPEVLEVRRKKPKRRKFVRREPKPTQPKPAARKQPERAPRVERPARKSRPVTQKPLSQKGKERPAWWYKTVDHALAAELDVKPRTLRVILGLGAKTVHEAAMLLNTRPAQVRNLGIQDDLCQALDKFERLREAS